MKLSKIVPLISLIIVFSSWLQSCGTAHKNVANPMTNEELQYFNKYVGKWGGSTWTHFDVGKRGYRDMTIEITIQEIDAKNRKTLLTYTLQESAYEIIYRLADCTANKIIFSTKNFYYQLVLKGEYLWATRKGPQIYQETTLKRME